MQPKIEPQPEHVSWTHIFVLYPWGPQSFMSYKHSQVSRVKNVCLMDLRSELEMCWFNSNIINWQFMNQFRICLMWNQINHNMRHRTSTKSCRFWNTCCKWSPVFNHTSSHRLHGFQHKHLSGQSLLALPSHGLCAQDFPAAPWGSNWRTLLVFQVSLRTKRVPAPCAGTGKNAQPSLEMALLLIFMLLSICYLKFSLPEVQLKTILWCFPWEWTLSLLWRFTKGNKESREVEILEVLMFYLITASILWQPKFKKKFLLTQELNNLAVKTSRGEDLLLLQMFVSTSSFLPCTYICKYIYTNTHTGTGRCIPSQQSVFL